MERSGRDRSKKVAAVEAGLKQAAENKRRKINVKKQKQKMKTVEFPSAPVTPTANVLDHTTLPMVNLFFHERKHLK